MCSERKLRRGSEQLRFYRSVSLAYRRYGGAGGNRGSRFRCWPTERGPRSPSSRCRTSATGARTRCEHFASTTVEASPAVKTKASVAGGFSSGRYWARTSDPQLVELVLSQLS